MLKREKCKNPTNIDRPTKAKVDLQTYYLSFSSDLPRFDTEARGQLEMALAIYVSNNHP